jgi:hypothetical protein
MDSGLLVKDTLAPKKVAHGTVKSLLQGPQKPIPKDRTVHAPCSTQTFFPYSLGCKICGFEAKNKAFKKPICPYKGTVWTVLLLLWAVVSYFSHHDFL